MKRSQPDSYQPPYPAYQAHPGADRPDYVAGLVAVQARNGATPTNLLAAATVTLSANPTGAVTYFSDAACTAAVTSGWS